MVKLIGINYKGAPVVLSEHRAADLFVCRHPKDDHVMLCDRSRIHPDNGKPEVVAYRSTFSVLAIWTHTDHLAGVHNIYLEV